MNKILLFGAGKSSSYLIKYLLHHCAEMNSILQIVDQNTSHVQAKYPNNPHLQLLNCDVHAQTERQSLISEANLVISLLPPHLHIVIAQDCLAFSKTLITASYISPEIQAMHQALQQKGVLFMCEMGLDPGIDHMSAMQIIDEIHADGGEITEFKSHCGGLVAPVSDTNPWHYKISWNPRNVVLAGQAGAHFLLNNQEVHISYDELFTHQDSILIDGIGQLSYYANRDSLSYKQVYQLPNVQTLMRTTLRYPAFIKAWQYLIQINATDQKVAYTDTTNLTFAAWMQQLLGSTEAEHQLKKICNGDDASWALLQYLDLFSNQLINIGANKSNADILQHIIEQKWKMNDADKDMIVMQHEFTYTHHQQTKKRNSTLVVIGEDKTYTAMAKTVGLPMAIFAKLMITNKITGLSGVQIPAAESVYQPVLKELAIEGIVFSEELL
jgi:saccharopine dehydrogenase-like NADP-dependent oxidoreductase